MDLSDGSASTHSGDGGGGGVGRGSRRRSSGKRVAGLGMGVGAGGDETVSARIRVVGDEDSIGSSDSWCVRSRCGGDSGEKLACSMAGSISNESNGVWSDRLVSATQVVVRFPVGKVTFIGGRRGLRVVLDWILVEGSSFRDDLDIGGISAPCFTP